MKNRVILFVLLLLGCYVQTVFVPTLLESFGRLPLGSLWLTHTVDVLLLFIVYLGLTRSLWSALIWAAIIGFMADVFGLGWRGSFVTSRILIVLGCVAIQHHIMARNIQSKMILVAVITVVEAILQLALSGVFERASHVLMGQWPYILSQSIINALVAPMFFEVLLVIDYFTLSRRSQGSFVVFSDQRRDGLASL